MPHQLPRETEVKSACSIWNIGFRYAYHRQVNGLRDITTPRSVLRDGRIAQAEHKVRDAPAMPWNARFTSISLTLSTSSFHSSLTLLDALSD